VLVIKSEKKCRIYIPNSPAFVNIGGGFNTEEESLFPLRNEMKKSAA